MVKDCLNCKWLSEPLLTHRWHQCYWPAPARVPSSVQVVRASVNVRAPFRDCPVWEAKVKPGGDIPRCRP